MATVSAQYIVNCSITEYLIVKAYIQQYYPDGISGWNVTFSDNQRRITLLRTDPNWSVPIL